MIMRGVMSKLENNKAEVDSKKTAADKAKTSRKTVELKELKELKKKLAESEKQVRELNEKYLRLAADYDNYRKRTQRDLGNIIEYAGEKVLRNILPILDDLQRALSNYESEEDSDRTLQQGLEMIYKKFTKTLKDMNVQPMKSQGQPFDPDLHDAVMAKEVEGVEPDMVVEEFEKG
ncbi:MAG TPA: nucleotide exchange factor GrpE, partial [Candidatus Marinimicrobia bacterium]|nr:nucleotide exchange factor GrpE [Candidatus Neomarinimicrobiota bacterium]